MKAKYYIGILTLIMLPAVHLQSPGREIMITEMMMPL